jgi:hypothetical protein
MAAPSFGAGEESADRHIVIVARDEGDSRLVAAREAITFWNQTFSDLSLRPRLLEDKVLVAPPMSRALENYTRKIWVLAGRSVSKEGGPESPQQLNDLEGDIVMFFSNQTFFSFAWPFARRARYFIGIQTGREAPMNYANVSRNVIAHELGHALGLEHNGNTRTLMCGPCEHLLYWSEQRVFFPLTSEERGRLRTLYHAR